MSESKDRGPNATPRTDATLTIGLKQHGMDASRPEAAIIGALVELARDLERELRLAQCPLHDCCGGKTDCAWYE